jgi:hypothetical protein
MTNAEEDAKQQERLERRLDREVRYLPSWLSGCVPMLALILLPLPLLMLLS